jgi:ketosteroid isomerase-like protein
MNRRTIVITGAAFGASTALEANAQMRGERGRRAVSLEAIVQELKDRTDILETMYAYCRAADNLNADGMVALFTDDCVVNYVVTDEALAMRGKQALRNMLVEYFASSTSSSHHIANAELIFETPDRVTMHAYMYSWQRFKGHPAAADCHRWGRYENQFVRTDAGWRLRRVRLVSAGEYGGARIGEQFSRAFPPRFD